MWPFAFVRLFVRGGGGGLELFLFADYLLRSAMGGRMGGISTRRRKGKMVRFCKEIRLFRNVTGLMT